MSDTTITSHRAAALTGASALAMYDSAETNPDKLRAAAAMADVLRIQTAPKAPKPARGPTDLLTAANLIVTMKRICMIVERRNTIPILSNVLLQATGDTLILTGTDLDVMYSETMRAPGIGVFKTTVGAHDLASAIAGATGEIGLRFVQLEGGVNVLHVTAAAVQTRLRCLDPHDFPVMLAPSTWDVKPVKPHAIELASADFLGPLGFVEPAISREETRYYLNGAYMQATFEQGLTYLGFTATDGSRLLQERVAVDLPGFNAIPPALIPLKSVGWILRNVRDDQLQLDIWATHVRITTATGVFITKLIDSNFPDFRRVIPSDSGSTVITIEATTAVSAVISRLAAYTKQRAGAVTLEVEAEMVEVSSKNMEGGKTNTVLAGAEAAGQMGRRYDFNGRYLAEMIGMDEPVEFHLYGGANDPARLSWPKRPGRVGVIMPLRQ